MEIEVFCVHRWVHHQGSWDPGDEEKKVCVTCRAFINPMVLDGKTTWPEDPKIVIGKFNAQEGEIKMKQPRWMKKPDEWFIYEGPTGVLFPETMARTESASWTFAQALFMEGFSKVREEGKIIKVRFPSVFELERLAPRGDKGK